MSGYPNVSLGPAFGPNRAIFSLVLPPIFSPFELSIGPVIGPNSAIISPVLPPIRSPFDLRIRPIRRPKQPDLTRDRRPAFVAYWTVLFRDSKEYRVYNTSNPKSIYGYSNLAQTL